MSLATLGAAAAAPQERTGECQVGACATVLVRGARDARKRSWERNLLDDDPKRSRALLDGSRYALGMRVLRGLLLATALAACTAKPRLEEAVATPPRDPTVAKYAAVLGRLLSSPRRARTEH